jgi:polyhydroxyalkanoate synthase subunit PhaE
MAEGKTDDTDWMSIQRKYWDAWLELTRHPMNGAANNNAPAPGVWADGLLKWWEAIAPAVPPSARESFDRMLALSQSYFRMAEQLFSSGASDSSGAANQWIESLNRTFRLLSEGATAATPRGTPDALAFWDLPLDTWRRTMSSLMPLPGDVLSGAKREGVTRTAAHLRDQIDRFLSIPAVGYTREAQDQYQNLIRLVMEYLDAMHAYNMSFARLGVSSTELLRKNIAAAGDSVNSLRSLYDLWVDTAEASYAEYVMSDEYAALYGRMVNALAAVKRQGSALVDEFLESMNIPTRQEINTMHKRLHELQRQNRALRGEIEQIKDLLNGGAHTPMATPPKLQKQAST